MYSFILNKLSEPPIYPTVPKSLGSVPQPLSSNKDLGRLLSNSKSISLCSRYEGFGEKRKDELLFPYTLPTKEVVVGYGTSYYPSGKKVKITDKPITQKQAKEFFILKMESIETVLKYRLEKLNLNLNLDQFSALTCFAYNVGLEVLLSETYTMARALNSRDLTKVANAFKKYNKYNRKKFDILTERRKREKNLFLNN